MVVKLDVPGVYSFSYGFGFEGVETQVGVQCRINEPLFVSVVDMLERDYSQCRFQGKSVSSNYSMIADNRYLISGTVFEVDRMGNQGIIRLVNNNDELLTSVAKDFGLPLR